MNKQEFGLAFGIMCDSLDEQLKAKGFKLAEKDVEKFEKIKTSIHVLSIHGYINDSTTTKAFQRLLKQIIKKMKPMEDEGI